MKKSQIITNKLNILQEYAIDENMPFSTKIEEMREKYSLNFIVGLIERFLIPAYKDAVLKEYISAELERMKILAVAGGEDPELLKFTLSDEQMKVILEHLTIIIKVIQL